MRIHGFPAWCLEKCFKVLHFFLQKIAVGQQIKGVEQRYGPFQLKQQFKCMSDMRLCLALEKAFVTALAQTRGCIDDELGVGREAGWSGRRSDCSDVRWYPCVVPVVRADLQVNQVVLATVMPRHRRECFPIDALFVNAQSAPCRFILKNLMSELIDAGSGLARTGVAGDEPAATKLSPLPFKPPRRATKFLRLRGRNKSQAAMSASRMPPTAKKHFGSSVRE